MLTFLAIIVSTPFQLIEYIYYRRKTKNFRHQKPPVFIIGHWRSGTTHLHNILCRDPHHSYVTTYQSVFPNNLLSKWIFKTFMALHIPEKRPSDNVRLSPDFPQEEEFALANMTPRSFYHFFYFPGQNDDYYQKYIRFEDADDRDRQKFEKKYKELVAKAVINTGGKRIILKNPANTGRLKVLLQMYPEAKFIFIYRNPVITYLSTWKFYVSLFPSTSLKPYDEEQIRSLIIRNYQKFMNDYLATRNLVKPENLIEIRFEDFDQHNMDYINKIYTQFGLESWDTALPLLRDYVSNMESYKKNRHRIRRDELDLIMKEWDFAMKAFGYQIPANLDIYE